MRWFGPLLVVEAQVLLETYDCGAKGVTESDQQIDVVDVPTTGEAVGEVVARIDNDDGLEVATVGTDETKTPLDGLGVVKLRALARYRPAVRESEGPAGRSG